MNRAASGFTLVEVLVALTLSVIVALLIHSVTTGVVGSGERLRDAAQAHGERQNALRWIRTALSSARGNSANGDFVGHRGTIEFSSSLPVPYGWTEPARVRLKLNHGRIELMRDSRMVASFGESIARVEFDYLSEPGLGSIWVNDWTSPVGLPAAVRMRWTFRLRGCGDSTAMGHDPQRCEAADTAVFALGERG